VIGDVITIYDCAWLVLESEAGDIICVFLYFISQQSVRVFCVVFFFKKKGLLLGFGINSKRRSWLCVLAAVFIV